MGVLPGMDVEIIQTYPSYVFQVGNTQVAVDSNIADDIFVKYT
jgi:Fe2+ transport system protein FeoA